MPLFKWFVMYCDDDDSHTLVPDKDVIYDRESATAVLPGQEAYFFDGGKKWRGVIKDAGNDCNALVKSRDLMNANKPKRDKSFCPGVPRRAKVKCNEALGGRRTLSSMSTSNSVQPVQETGSNSSKEACSSDSRQSNPMPSCSQSKSNRGQKENEVSLSDLENGSDDSLTEEEKQLLSKLARKKKRADMKVLADLAAKPSSGGDSCEPAGSDGGSPVAAKKSRSTNNNISDSESEADGSFIKVPSNSTATVATGGKPKTADTVAKKSKWSTNNNILDSESEADGLHSNNTAAVATGGKPKTADTVNSSDEQSSDNDRPSSPKIPKRRPKTKSSFVKPKLQFTGEFYLHKETDPNVVQLHEDHKVFVPERIIKEVKRDSSINTTSALTRFIIKRVFTKEALLACSVFGRPSACKGRDAMTCKPALDGEGVQAIIKFVLARAEKKKWKSAVRATVTAAMANVICEGRDQQQLENSAQ